MREHNSRLLLILASSLLVISCTSSTVEKDQFSGFLPNYALLKETTSPSGQPVMRWVNKDFNPNSYDAIAFDKLELYPSPKPNEKIDNKTLIELQEYASASAKKAIPSNFKIITTDSLKSYNGRAIVIKAAITGVSASNEGMKWYEVVPVAAVVGAASAASGYRDQDTELYIEASVVDARTKKPMMYVVRKVFGRDLENSQQKIKVDDFKAALQEMNKDLSTMLSR